MKRLLILIMTFGAMLFNLEAWAKYEQMEVVNVSVGDRLNMREGPNVSYPITSSLPYDAKNIRVLRWAEEYTGSSLWVKIKWHGQRGWVNSRYLKAYKKTNTQQKIFNCFGTEPFWDINIYTNKVKVNTLNGIKFTAPLLFHGRVMNSPAGTTMTNASIGNKSVVVMTEKKQCDDGMSDNIYPYQALVLINGDKAYSGCCD